MATVIYDFDLDSTYEIDGKIGAIVEMELLQHNYGHSPRLKAEDSCFDEDGICQVRSPLHRRFFPCVPR